MPEKFSSFSAFYPYYLAEHSHPVCRALHYIGTTLVLLLIGFVLYYQRWALLWLLPVLGYGFAWIGHFVFEKNRPATFKHPLYSFLGDWLMWWQFITRIISSLKSS